MFDIPVSLGERAYTIHIGENLAGTLFALADRYAAARRPIAVVTSPALPRLHPELFAGLAPRARLVFETSVDGEGAKTVGELAALWEKLAQALLELRGQKHGLPLVLVVLHHKPVRAVRDLRREQSKLFLPASGQAAADNRAPLQEQNRPAVENRVDRLAHHTDAVASAQRVHVFHGEGDTDPAAQALAEAFGRGETEAVRVNLRPQAGD